MLSRLVSVVTAAVIALSAYAQAPLDESADSAVMTDSARIAMMSRMLDDQRLREDSLRGEIDLLRVAVLATDSMKRVRLKHQIDSIKPFTPGAFVVVEGDTLFTIYARYGGMTAEQRAERCAAEIMRLGKLFALKPDSVYILSADIITDVMYGDEVIISLNDLDGLWAGCGRDSLATQTRRIIVDELVQLNREHGFWQLVKRLSMFVVVIMVMFMLIKGINVGHRKLMARIARVKRTKLKPFYIQNVELLDTRRQVSILVFLAKTLRILVIFVLLAVALPLMFSIFPQTKEITNTIISYIWSPLYNILKDIVAYIPNLFTIIVICLVVRWIVKGLHYIADEVASERLKFNGFFPDWARPTFYIVRFLLYAFMIAMIYPYLPGADSGIFQGISVFVGLIVSLGSSSVIGNIIAGLVITYMRPFKMGDRVEIKDTTGDVIEKTPLVTRIRTIKNEVVTIPNSFIMSSQTINYTESARQFGLIIHTDVTTNYDVPWQKVYALLIDAALNTPGVVDDPRPFVLQTQLGDNYPVYQINAYIRDAHLLPDIYSLLHQSILDRLTDAGIEILSPKYFVTCDLEDYKKR